MRTPLIALAALATLTIAAAGCGGSSSGGAKSSKPANPNTAEVSPSGDIPDNQAFVPYTPPGADYSVKVPEGWARRASGKAVTFADKLNSVTMEAVPGGTKLPTGQAGRNVSTVARKAGPAVRVTYVTTAKADPVTGRKRKDAVERYVFRHRSENVVLTLTGAKGADNVDPWRIVTDSLRFTR